MQTAGFELAELQGAQEPGIWQKVVELRGREIVVPIDLIVPSEVAPPGGRRGARLEGHGKRAARKISGLEAALIDNEMMSVEALEPDDLRSARLRVAGVAALLVAKTHKIVDRIESGRDDRLGDKDGADVVRLMGASSPAAVASTLEELMDNPPAAAATSTAVERFEELFGRRAGVGIALASRALREAMPEERVRAICLAYTEKLYATLSEAAADRSRLRLHTSRIALWTGFFPTTALTWRPRAVSEPSCSSPAQASGSTSGSCVPARLLLRLWRGGRLPQMRRRPEPLAGVARGR